MSIATRPFGRTGHQSTRTIFGAAALASVTQDVANRTLDVLLDHGINHIDVAASYGDAELRVGAWMREHRDRFFLATKTGERSCAGARDELHRSLDRLRVDAVDLIQLHNLVDPIDWDQALSPGGALDALIEAREQGLVRFIGVTGHGLSIAAMHRRSLDRFEFDSVLLPYNSVIMRDDKYAADFAVLLDLCTERKVAVQTIKSIARGPWLGREATTTTWYEPLVDPASISLAVQWVLADQRAFLNTVGDVTVLPHVLEAAGQPSSDDQEALGRQLASLQLEPLFV
jgi:aryl-alcohol dehydrogenase-like predicted oxidoreductase